MAGFLWSCRRRGEGVVLSTGVRLRPALPGWPRRRRRRYRPVQDLVRACRHLFYRLDVLQGRLDRSNLLLQSAIQKRGLLKRHRKIVRLVVELGEHRARRLS